MDIRCGLAGWAITRLVFGKIEDMPHYYLTTQFYVSQLCPWISKKKSRPKFSFFDPSDSFGWPTSKMTSLKKFVGSVILSYTGDICKICKKDGWLFATHSFTNSRHKVRKWLANWTIMTQAVFNWKWLTLQFLAALKCSENLDAVGLLGFNLWKWICMTFKS